MEIDATAVVASAARAPELDIPLAWSSWARLQTSFSVALTPHEPGVFALAEEVLAEGESALVGHRRMLALFQIAAADDLAHAMVRLFSTDMRERLESGRCYVRYALVADRGRREAVCTALQTWLAASAETASSITQGLAADAPAPREEARRELGPPPPLPAGF